MPPPGRTSRACSGRTVSARSRWPSRMPSKAGSSRTSGGAGSSPARNPGLTAEELDVLEAGAIVAKAARASFIGRPDHAARSSGPAGGWARAWRRASSASAVSRSGSGPAGPSQSSVSAYVGSRPRAPASITWPAAAALITRWMGACGWSSSRWPAARTWSAISWRVRGPSRSAAGTAAVASGPMPICSRRRRPRASPTGPSSAASQRASSAGTRCSVPRMHQIRATERSSKRAWSTAEAVAPGSRARTPRAAAGASWACNPATRRTTSSTVAALPALDRRAAGRWSGVLAQGRKEGCEARRNDPA